MAEPNQGAEGVTFDSAPVSQDTPIQAAPSGVTFDQTPVQQDTPAHKVQSRIPEPTMMQKIAGAIPEPIMSGLASFDKHVSQPLNELGEKGAEIGKGTFESIAAGAQAGARMRTGEDVAPSDTESFEKNNPVQAGVIKGLGGAAGSTVGDPRNWPFFLSGGNTVRPLLSKLMSRGFAVQLGEGAVSTLHQLYSHWDEMTPEQRAETATQGGVQAALSTVSALHSFTKAPPSMQDMANFMMKDSKLAELSTAERLPKIHKAMEALKENPSLRQAIQSEMEAAEAAANKKAEPEQEVVGSNGRASRLRPTTQQVGGTSVPVRNPSTIGKIATAAVSPEIPRNFALEQTGPAVAKGIGDVAKDAVGATGETAISGEDRFGILGHAEELKGRSQSGFQRIDEMSGNKLSDAQEEASNSAMDFTTEGREKYHQALAKQDALFEQYRDQLKGEGIDVDKLKSDWRKQLALRSISKTLNTATEASETGNQEYQIKQNKQLANSVDNLIKRVDKQGDSAFDRAGFTKEHIDQLKKFGQIVRDQANVPKISGMTRGIGRVMLGMLGFEVGGPLGMAAGVGAEFGVEKAITALADRALGKILTTPEGLKAANEAIQSGNAQGAKTVVNSLKKADPTWWSTITDYAKKLWSDEKGTLTIGGHTSNAVAETANKFNIDNGRDAINRPEGKPHPDGMKIADDYERMVHDPKNPEVHKSYSSFKSDIDAQWDHLQQEGYVMEPWTEKGQPYKNSEEMMKDVHENKHLYFFTGGDFPADHPMAERDPQTGLTYTDKFRAVHDIFGHAAGNFGFGPGGEEGAYKTHAQTLSPESIPALTSETRGQNNWVNNGPHMRNDAGDLLKPGDEGYLAAPDRPYAEQKAGLIPAEHSAMATELPFQKMLQAHIEKGGTTFDIHGDMTGKDKWAVSAYPERTQRINGNPLLSELKAYAKKNADLLSKPGNVIGTWRDDNGVTHLDITRTIADRGEAVKAAKAANQQAIYHLKTGELLSTGGTGEVLKPEQTESPLEQNKQQLFSNKERDDMRKMGMSDAEIDQMQQHQTATQSSQPVIEPNGSGDSSASLESVNRTASEKEQGIRRVEIDTRKPNATPRPLIGVDAVDAKPSNPYAKIGIIHPDGTFEEVASGDRAKPLPPSLLENFKREAQPIANEAKRVGQRIPSSVKGDQSHNPDLSLGMDAIEAAGPKYMQKLADRVTQYNGMQLGDESFGGEDTQSDPKTVLNSFIDHAAGNIKWLYDQVPESIRKVSRQWYDSAHTMTKQWATQYGLAHEQAAGILAVLSPQNPWDNNIAIATRLMDAMKNKQNHAWTPEMTKKLAELHSKSSDIAKFGDMIKGKKLSQLKDADPDVQNAMKGLWIRIFDESHNPRTFERHSPDGKVVGVARNDSGSLARSNWFSIDPIAKAVSIYENGSMENINQRLGFNHKVRNFYNNIVSPNSKMGDTTVDTHAVGVAHLKPLSLKSTEVDDNFKSPRNAEQGLAGTYPLYAEAYKRAAAKIGILPRQLQSVTWDAIRGLFSDKDYAIQGAVEDIWKEYQDGEITINQARQRIVKAAGGFKPPDWLSDISSNASAGSPANPSEVSGNGVSGQPSSAAVSGRGNGAASAVPAAGRGSKAARVLSSVQKGVGS